MDIKPAWEINKIIKIRAEEETDSRYGNWIMNRDLKTHIRYGLIVLDKPAGPTSHEVAAWVKKLLELDKVGHGGTLDPKVTGVLPITLQESTKIVQAILDAGKEYICIMRTHQEEPENRILNILRLFEGEIFQRPPLRSSVKRRLRTRYIYSIQYLEGDGRNWLFKVSCQSGTYIRKLCFDLGEVLGNGAHMRELRRIRSGPFTEEETITFHDLDDALDLYKTEDVEESLRELIRPMEDGLKLIPKIWIRDSAVDAICHGAQLTVPGVLRAETGISPNSLVAIMTQKEEAVALMRSNLSTGQILNKEHGVVAFPNRVLMPRGTYPKMWRG